MHSLFLATTLERSLGGIARSVPRLAQAVAEAGARVELFAPRPQHPAVDPRELSALSLRLADSPRELRDMLRRAMSGDSPPDVVYHAGVWSPMNHFCATLARRHGIPLVVSPRSMLDPWALDYRRWKKRLAWWLYARRDLSGAAMIHVTAPLEAEHVRRTGLKNPLVMIPNGIEVPESMISTRGGPPPRKDWIDRSDPTAPGTDAATCGTRGGPPPRKDRIDRSDPAAPACPPKPFGEGRGTDAATLRRILFLSRLHPKKGLMDLVEAFARLRPAGWELVIAGNDEDGNRARVEKRVAALGLGDSVRFAGYVDGGEKWRLYRDADLFVLPSYSENFGLVVGEALACGVPVVTTTATPWQDLDQRGCGWCIPPGVAPLTTTLKLALQQPPSTLREMGSKGKEWVSKSFSWRTIGEGMKRALEVVGRGR